MGGGEGVKWEVERCEMGGGEGMKREVERV